MALQGLSAPHCGYTMKNPVPFVDEEYLMRDKQASPPAQASTARPSSPGAQAPAQRRHSVPGPAPRPPTPTRRPVEARVYWHPTHNGQCLKVNISGNPDVRTLRQWRRLLHDCRRLHTHRFEFDLQETEEMGLAALALLLLLKERQQVTPRDMVLNQCTRQVCQLLEWTGLTDEFTIRAQRGSE